MAKLEYDKNGRLMFTKEMKEEYTLLVPMMLPIHFSMLKSILQREGYKVEILETQNSNIIQMGLKYCHNDICYPALLTIGQLMDALQSGKYDIHKVAVVMTQTGRRLPGFQLYQSAAQSAGSGRAGFCAGGIGQLQRTGRKSGLCHHQEDGL